MGEGYQDFLAEESPFGDKCSALLLYRDVIYQQPHHNHLRCLFKMMISEPHPGSAKSKSLHLIPEILFEQATQKLIVIILTLTRHLPCQSMFWAFHMYELRSFYVWLLGSVKLVNHWAKFWSKMHIESNPGCHISNNLAVYRLFNLPHPRELLSKTGVTIPTLHGVCDDGISGTHKAPNGCELEHPREVTKCMLSYSGC